MTRTVSSSSIVSTWCSTSETFIASRPCNLWPMPDRFMDALPSPIPVIATILGDTRLTTTKPGPLDQLGTWHTRTNIVERPLCPLHLSMNTTTTSFTPSSASVSLGL